MLILTRRIGEAVIIGDDISIKILGIRGNQVRLGIEAPKTVPVHRTETYEKINRGLDKDNKHARETNGVGHTEFERS